MNSSDKGFSSSTTIKPPPIPKFTIPDAGGTYENEKNFDKMSSKLHNPLKNPPVKHFMSPTISAASKASVSRKKILGERNEASNFTYIQNLDSKTSPFCSFDSSDRYLTQVSEFDDDEQNTCFSDSSSPYDPLTNYLSPRPKFLRYKPKRLRETFFVQENDSGRGKDVSGVKSSVCLHSQRIFVTQRDEENVTVKEKDDGSSVKSSTCLVSQRNIDKSEKVQSSQERIVKQEDRETGGENPEEESDEEIEEFEKRNFSILKEMLKSLLVFVILSLFTIYICSMNHHSWTPRSTWGVKYGYQQIQNHSSQVVNFENFGRERSLVQREWTQFFDYGFEEEVPSEEKIKGLVESADEVIEVVDEEKQVTRTENAEDGYDAELEREEEEVSVSLEEKENEKSEDVKDDNLAITSEFSGIELSETGEKSQPLHVEGDCKIETNEGILKEGVEKEAVENKKEETVEGIIETADGISQGKIDSVMGFSVVVIVIAALSLFGFGLRRKKSSLPVEKLFSESVSAKKSTSVDPVLLPNMEVEHVEKVELGVNSSLVIRSTDETTKKSYQIHAPTVELLGEFSVGETNSSTIKNCGMKSKMMDIEVRSNSIFQENGLGSNMAHAFSTPEKPSASEFSIMNSPSYGEKKTVKKEEGREGAVKTSVTTPMRRSSRIRNRVVMSP